MIEVRDLVKRYGDHLAVDHLSFRVEKGQIYGFLGPNGAGKTTTMNIMTGYIGPTEGEVIINGHNILDEPEEAKRSIGYLPELPPLYTDMTPREYLNFAAELKSLDPGELEESVQKVMKLTKIDDVQDRLIKNLSKGYRQRVGLAQAILGMPEILILDEPTVGLDPKQILEIRELIRSLSKEHTIILSSHILSEVSEVCDRVLIIHHGRLIATGSPGELERQLKGTTIELTVKSDDIAAVQKLFESVEGAGRVTCTPAGAENEISVAVDPKDNLDLREALFRACAKADCPLLMMRPSGVSLESIFLELTSDRAAPGEPGENSTEAEVEDDGTKDGDDE
ncbi:ABC-2 type transport system ATP-binding protein [Sporobacter termitidis DSM 10068]|uniref:ABC-2 type transport system ATP-binding protein n=1 Tax=Sporobacter termitidis DSM 10068 TaxID=1123282 RepID=A0A1M5VPM0_9FIRM|nr:ABC transporter ATP-binding protein [Sporobacter termitidis]SHH77128.1 ABC-2 type transport system ATP-binding protein [Sporobacter termitidis DSM 10068]